MVARRLLCLGPRGARTALLCRLAFFRSGSSARALLYMKGLPGILKDLFVYVKGFPGKVFDFLLLYIQYY